MVFEVKRGTLGGETEWLINGKPFDPAAVAASLRNPAGRAPRGFRDFVGPYVAHCHNLAHEDHAMMFGWSITP
jgi:hypothetical protein